MGYKSICHINLSTIDYEKSLTKVMLSYNEFGANAY